DGQERTADEYRLLLARAEFEVTEIIEAGQHISIVEARPA
ncbi:MAG: methyltransferase, partial [Mesorhizobium sp.]